MISKPSLNFGKQYKTEDILAFTTSYPYKDKYIQPEIVKSLTGIDIDSDEFRKSVPQNYDAGFMQFAVISLCIEKVLSQNEKLRGIIDTFVPRSQNKKVRKENNLWFKHNIQQFGETIDIDPFILKSDEVKKSYEDFMDTLNKIF